MMSKCRSRISLILTVAVPLLVAANHVGAGDLEDADPTVVIAVVRDGPPAGEDLVPEDLVPEIEEELAKHLQIGTSARFKSTPSFNAGWDVARVPGALASALADPETDIVLVTGPLATAVAAEMELGKPVVSAFLQPADVFRMPFGKENRSLRTNLAFMVLSQSAERDIEAFRSLTPFESLHILVGAEFVAGLDVSSAQLRTAAEALGIRIEIVPVSPDDDTDLAALGSNVEAVYLTAMPRFSSETRRRLIAGLTGSGIPTFADQRPHRGGPRAIPRPRHASLRVVPPPRGAGAAG